jgi:NAD(P)H-hydrate epimerase
MSLAASFPPDLVFDRAAVQSVDREAIEAFGIPGMVLMENAARGLADQALNMLDEPSATVLICCGSGNNGGDGYALARHLRNHGHEPMLASMKDPHSGTDAGVNASICDQMGIPRVDRDDAPDPTLLVDAIFGTGLDRPVSGEPAEWITWINDHAAPVLAVDAPSGLDCDTGEPLGPTVRATHTVTFVGMKRGFLAPGASAYTGEVTVVEIGAPIALHHKYGERRRDEEK